jgi:hypothetical protein
VTDFPEPGLADKRHRLALRDIERQAVDSPEVTGLGRKSIANPLIDKSGASIPSLRSGGVHLTLTHQGSATIRFFVVKERRRKSG